jgi:hypothetical protein
MQENPLCTYLAATDACGLVGDVQAVRVLPEGSVDAGTSLLAQFVRPQLLADFIVAHGTVAVTFAVHHSPGGKRCSREAEAGSLVLEEA